MTYATYPHTHPRSGTRVGLGADPAMDNTVQAAAGALLQGLQNGTITARINPIVRAFQQAWLNAGGALAPTITSSTGADGMYGKATEAVLQSVLDSVYGPGQAAVPGFTQAQLTAANGGGGGSASGGSGGGTTTTSTSNTTEGLASWVPWALGAAFLAVGGVGTAVLYKKQHKGGAKSRKPMFRFRRRRAYARA